ncbi:MAG: hypothetical protein DBY17_05070 [Oscillospiraceae bacterium]|nr:MAG: hypothetical protein DBY17_05070 [Oscillospiraceae bacterium]
MRGGAQLWPGGFEGRACKKTASLTAYRTFCMLQAPKASAKAGAFLRQRALKDASARIPAWGRRPPAGVYCAHLQSAFYLSAPLAGAFRLPPRGPGPFAAHRGMPQPSTLLYKKQRSGVFRPPNSTVVRHPPIKRAFSPFSAHALALLQEKAIMVGQPKSSFSLYAI